MTAEAVAIWRLRKEEGALAVSHNANEHPQLHWHAPGTGFDFE